MRFIIIVLVLALSVQVVTVLAGGQSTISRSLTGANDDRTHLTIEQLSLNELIAALEGLEKPEGNQKLMVEIAKRIEKDPVTAFEKRLANVPSEIKEAILQKLFPFTFFTKKISLACSHVHCIAWPSDCKHIIYGTQHGVITMRCPKDGACEKLIFGHDDEIKAVACSPDGKRFASGAKDRKILIHSMEEDGQKRLIGHTKGVTSVAWSGDSTLLASGSKDKSIRIWDAEEGKVRRELMGHTGKVTSVAWGPHGKRIASGSTDGTARIWQADTGKEILVLTGHAATEPWSSSAVRSVAWSPDGVLLASGSDDRSIIIWDALTGKQKKKLDGHSKAVRDISWSPDGNYLASVSFDGTIRVWDIATGAPLQVLKREALVDSVAWSPDGTYLVSGDDEAIIWERYTPTMSQVGVLMKVKQHKELNKDEHKVYDELPQEMKDVFPVARE